MQKKRITLVVPYPTFKKLHQLSYTVGISKNYLINYLIKKNIDTIKPANKSPEEIQKLKTEIEECLGVTIRNYG